MICMVNVGLVQESLLIFYFSIKDVVRILFNDAPSRNLKIGQLQNITYT